MKKFLILIFFVPMIIFAEGLCYFPDPIDIYFKDSTIWYGPSSFLWGGPTIVDDTVSETLADGYLCNKERQVESSEKAFLDSNVFLFRHESNGRNILSIYNAYEMLKGLHSERDVSHSVGAVFKEEFLHWRQCGMLNLSYEEADSLATLFVMAINKFVEDKNVCTETDDFIVCSFAHNVPSQLKQWIDEFCEANGLEYSSKPAAYCEDPYSVPERVECAQVNSILIQQPKKTDVSIAFENRKAHIPEPLRGNPFFLFDMNGKVIQRGVAGETIRMLVVPSILKIGTRVVICK